MVGRSNNGTPTSRAGEKMTDESGQEIEATIAGQSVRAKGYRLIDLIWLPLVLGVGYTAMTVYNHSVEAKDEKVKIAKTLKESNESVAQALKDSNDNTAAAIKAMAMEQRKATNVLREMSCLLDPSMKNRPDARDFCKRITREDR